MLRRWYFCYSHHKMGVVFVVLTFLLAPGWNKYCGVFAAYQMNYTAPDYPSNGKSLEGSVLRAFDYSHHVVICAKACLSEGKCKSFNYKEESKLCELNTHSHLTAPNNIVDREGFVYLAKEAYHLPREALGKCAEDLCKNNGTCQDTCTGGFVCFCVYGEWMGDTCEDQVIHGQWGNWGSWEECPVTCGRDVRYRRRRCDNPAPSDYGGKFCQHDNGIYDTDAELCAPNPCPQWSMWYAWSSCLPGDTSCGEGVRSRTRDCLNNGQPNVDPGCTGSVNEPNMPCISRDCDVPIRINSGSTTYGEGYLEIYDNIHQEWGTICSPTQSSHPWSMTEANVACMQMGFSGAYAIDSTAPMIPTGSILLESVNCNGDEWSLARCTHTGWRDVSSACTHQYDVKVKCKVDCQWKKWTPWSDCSVTCGSGTRTRTRITGRNAANGGNPCDVNQGSQTMACELNPCIPATCNQRKSNPVIQGETLNDGVYTIKPSSTDDVVINVYCDMTRDGGGWTLVLVATSNNVWDEHNMETLNMNSPSISGDHSILKFANDIRDNSETDTVQYRIEAMSPGINGGIYSVTKTTDLVGSPFGTTSQVVEAFQSNVTLGNIVPHKCSTSGIHGCVFTMSSSPDYGMILQKKGTYPDAKPAPFVCVRPPCVTYSGTIWYWIKDLVA